jgi:hypothetical protein
MRKYILVTFYINLKAIYKELLYCVHDTLYFIKSSIVVQCCFEVSCDRGLQLIALLLHIEEGPRISHGFLQPLKKMLV